MIDHLDAFLKFKSITQAARFRSLFRESARDGDIERLMDATANTLSSSICDISVTTANGALANAINQNIGKDSSIRALGSRVLEGGNIEEALTDITIRLLAEAIWFMFQESAVPIIYFIVDGLHMLPKDDCKYLVELLRSQNREGSKVRFLLCTWPQPDVCRLLKDFPRIDKASETKSKRQGNPY